MGRPRQVGWLFLRWSFAMKVDRSKWPVMVQLGLWGLPSRGAAWGFIALSIALAVGCVAYGFVDARFFFGGVFFFAALWYYLSVRWVDQKSSWP
jgi:hypothetical protein